MTGPATTRLARTSTQTSRRRTRIAAGRSRASGTRKIQRPLKRRTVANHQRSPSVHITTAMEQTDARYPQVRSVSVRAAMRSTRETGRRAAGGGREGRRLACTIAVPSDLRRRAAAPIRLRRRLRGRPTVMMRPQRHSRRRPTLRSSTWKRSPHRHATVKGLGSVVVRGIGCSRPFAFE